MSELISLMVDEGNAPPRSGTGVYTRGLIEALKTFAGSDLAVTEACISSNGTSLRPIRRLVYLARLGALVSRGYDGADVIHFTNIYCPRRRNRTAVVVTVHDLDPIEFPSLYSRRYATYFNNVVRHADERAHIILTVSNSARTKLLNWYGWDDRRVLKAGVGVNPAFEASMAEVVRHSEKKQPVLLLVGRLLRKKNHAWVIHATTKGIKRGVIPSVRMVIAGNRGDGLSDVLKSIRESNGLVEWIENPDFQTLARLYASASVFLFPSISEGFGSPLLEAMHVGIPIVASRIPSSLEVVGDVASFFELGNEDEYYEALRIALQDRDPQSRTARGKNALRRYSWKNLTSEYVEAYKQAQIYSREMVLVGGD